MEYSWNLHRGGRDLGLESSRWADIPSTPDYRTLWISHKQKSNYLPSWWIWDFGGTPYTLQLASLSRVHDQIADVWRVSPVLYTDRRLWRNKKMSAAVALVRRTRCWKSVGSLSWTRMKALRASTRENSTNAFSEEDRMTSFGFKRMPVEEKQR